MGFERIATVTTNPVFERAAQDRGVEDAAGYIEDMISAEADMMAVMILRQRRLAEH